MASLVPRSEQAPETILLDDQSTIQGVLELLDDPECRDMAVTLTVSEDGTIELEIVGKRRKTPPSRFGVNAPRPVPNHSEKHYIV